MSGPFLIDSDVLIWHLRGNQGVVEHVQALAGRGEILVCAVSRAEVLLGMRQEEATTTYRLLNSLRTVAVDDNVADLAAASVREQRGRGVTIHLPDALIGAAAVVSNAELHTCNPRHFTCYEIMVKAVVVS
jgi:predicted nucleic acid-binding protein